MAAVKFYFGYTVLITTFYVELWHKMYMLCFHQYISVFEQRQGPKLRKIVLASFRKQNSFNNSRKDATFDIDFIDSMFNILRSLELANMSVLFTSTLKHYHTQWSPNIIQWLMYEAIVKYVIQSLGFVKQGINPKFTLFLQLIKEFRVLKGVICICLSILALTMLKCSYSLVKPQHVHFIP